jgi:hypothetical protein
MKLNKNILKSLIVESLEEMGDPRDEMTGTRYDDVRSGMENEPIPEELEPLDIAAFFRQVGEEIQDRIKMIENMPRAKLPVAMPPEELKIAMDEMQNVQKELESIKKALESAKQNLNKKKH